MNDDHDLARARALLDLRRLPEARAAVGRALGSDGDRAAALTVLAQIELAINDVDAAEQAIADGLQIEATAGRLHIAAIVARRRGDHDRALRLLDDAVALAPQSSTLHAARAMALAAPLLDERPSTATAGDDERLERAQAAADRAVAIDPESATARYAVGVVLLAAGELADAARALLEAAELDPHWPDPHRLLAIVRARQGMGALASQHLVTAGRLDPGDGRDLNRLREAAGPTRRPRWPLGRRRRNSPEVGADADFMSADARSLLAADARLRHADLDRELRPDSDRHID